MCKEVGVFYHIVYTAVKQRAERVQKVDVGHLNAECWCSHLVADPAMLNRGAENNVSAPSSFIANAHNAFYVREKATCLKNGEYGRGPPPSFESATVLDVK